jgi:two-component system sensor histidine kinase VanS
MSARARLTLTFTGLLFVVGVAIVASVVVAMRYLPRYDITTLSTPLEAHPNDEAAAARPLSVPDSSSAGPHQTTESWPAELFPATLTIEGENDLLRVLLTTSLVVFVVALAGGAWLSWVLAGRLLRPLDHLTEIARTAELGQGSRRRTTDHDRLALSGPHDEFHRLASAFDAMLARLDAAYGAQQRFAANASHELRTPLVTTQAMLDVALAEPAGVDVELLGRRLRETNTRSLRTVEALLTLADATGSLGEVERVDLQALVTEAVGRARPAASAAGTALDDDLLQELVVDGDRVLLTALVTNLLDNALRHGRRGGFVAVVLRGRVLSVVNDGDVLDPDDVASFTGAFHRGAGRVASHGGHGLGLAIVSAICDRHGARLELSANPDGGLRVDVTF